MVREGQVRIPAGCAIAAVISRDGRKMNGQTIIDSMVPMHERSNGLGGGFAAYGIYPEYKELYALHIFYDDNSARTECEALLKDRFEIVKAENIPIRKIPEITDVPLIWRYFVAPLSSILSRLLIPWMVRPLGRVRLIAASAAGSALAMAVLPIPDGALGLAVVLVVAGFFLGIGGRVRAGGKLI